MIISLTDDINRRPDLALPVPLEALSTEALIELSDRITDELARRYDEVMEI